MERLYKIQENLTTGWVDIDELNCKKLTKDQCKERLSGLVQEGYNPNYLRVQVDYDDQTSS